MGSHTPCVGRNRLVVRTLSSKKADELGGSQGCAAALILRIRVTWVTVASKHVVPNRFVVQCLEDMSKNQRHLKNI